MQGANPCPHRKREVNDMAQEKIVIDSKKARELMAAKGIMQSELSVRCGYSKSWLSNILNNDAPVHKSIVLALAHELGCDCDDLIKRDDEKTGEVSGELFAEIAESLKKIAGIAETMKRIADALEVKEASASKENVQAAKGILETLTQATGEVTAEKYNRSCDMRSISQKERVIALDESNCQYQWRDRKNGEKACYVVRGC